MRKPCKNDAPVEKVAIPRRHLIDRVPVSDLCDEHQLSSPHVYRWQNRFLENGAAALVLKDASTSNARLRTIAALRVRLERKYEVVAQLME